MRKLTALLSLLLLLWSAPIQAAVARDGGYTPAITYGGSVSTLDHSVTISTVTDGLLVAVVQFFSAGVTVTSVVLDPAGVNTALTEYGSLVTTNNHRTAIYYLLDASFPTNGTYTLRLTLSSSSPAHIYLGAVIYTGVNQSTPLTGDTNASVASDADTTHELSAITSESGDVVMEVCSSSNTTDHVHAGSQVALWENTASSSTMDISASDINGSASVTMGCTTDANETWLMRGFNIEQAAAGAPANGPRLLLLGVADE